MTEKCGAIGALIVGGRVVGQVKCDLDAGHESDPVYRSHTVTLLWTPETEPDLDLFDPGETFDVDVSMAFPSCSVCGGALIDVGTAASGPTYVHRDPLGEWPTHAAAVPRP